LHYGGSISNSRDIENDPTFNRSEYRLLFIKDSFQVMLASIRATPRLVHKI